MLKGTAICALACSAAAFTPSTIPLRMTHRSSVAPLHSVAQSDSPTQPRRQFLLQVGSFATALSSACVSPALALSPPADAPVGTEDDPYSPASIDKQVCVLLHLLQLCFCRGCCSTSAISSLMPYFSSCSAALSNSVLHAGRSSQARYEAVSTKL